MTATQEAPGLTKNIDVRPINKPKKPLPFPLSLYQTAVGKKWVMALTGIGIMGFVFAHMIGNLKMYLGAEEYNTYAESLRELLHPIMPKHVVLWVMRFGMIGMFAFHIHSAYTLTLMNRRSKPQRYSRQDYVAANYASRTMRVSGILLAAFLLMHLANLTWGKVLTGKGFVEGEVYANVIHSLEQPLVAALYIVGQLALASHLFHGAWSIFQSLGINNPRYNGLRKGFAYGFTALVCGLNLTFPVAVLAGIVKL